MGKYSSRKAPERPRDQVNPGQSTLGCLLMVIIPAISIFLAIQLVNYGLNTGKVPIPYELRGYITLPDLFYQSSGLRQIFGPLTRINNLAAYVVMSILTTLVLGGISSLIFTLAIRAVNSPADSQFYVPPPDVKIRKKYKR